MPQRRALALAALFFAIASLARLWLALVRPLWHDEIFTVWVSRMSPAGVVAALRADSGPPLHYILSRALAHLAELWNLPDSFLRLLSFAAIAALAFGIRSLPPGTARAAFLVLLAASPLLGFYSAEARAYGLLAAVDFALFVELRQRRDDVVHAILVAILAAAALLTHYLAVFFVGAVGLVAILERRWRKLAALLAGGALALPWLPILLRQPSAATGWLRESSVVSAAGFFSSLGGVGRIPPAFGASVPAALVWLGAAAGAVLAGALAAPAKRDHDLRAGLVAVGATLAAVLAAAVVRPVAFAGRTEMAVLPVWMWAVARGVGVNRVVRYAAAATALLGAVAFAWAVPGAAGRPEPSPSRVAAVLERSAAREDLVVAATAFYLPLRLARDRGGLRARLSGFPVEIERHPGWFKAEPAPDVAYDELADELARRPPGSRTWIAVHPLYVTPRLRETLDTRGTVRTALDVPDAAVLVWTPGKGAPEESPPKPLPSPLRQPAGVAPVSRTTR